MSLFSNENVKIDLLKKKAYNYRWAEVKEGTIPLTAADPDYPVAKEIRQAMIDYIEEGYFSYTPKTGYEEFKLAIAKSLNDRKSEGVDPAQVLPIDSAARGMYIIAETILEEGDEMIVFDPVDFLFKESALAAKATPVLFPAKVKDGYIDLSELESYITSKTKMIGLCNPHNPLGTVYRQEDLTYILDLCIKYDLYIMNDEIWSDIIYSDSKFLSILALDHPAKERVLSVFGFSKSFGIAGMRIGCIHTQSQELFDKVIDVSEVMTTAGGIASLAQIAGIACLNDSYYWVEDFLKHLQVNRDYAVNRVNKMPMVTTISPSATYLLYIDVKELNMSSLEFTKFLDEEVGLALVPGGEKFFGPGSEGYVRLCFATSREILEEGLNRLEKGLNMLLKL